MRKFSTCIPSLTNTVHSKETKGRQDVLGHRSQAGQCATEQMPKTTSPMELLVPSMRGLSSLHSQTSGAPTEQKKWVSIILYVQRQLFTCL